MKPTKSRKAFTLVEVLVVIVIIGILFVVVVANVDFSTDAAREAGAQNTLHAYELACKSVGLEYSGFTNDLDSLVKYLNKKLDDGMQLKHASGKIVTDCEDPWGTKFDIKFTEPVGAVGELRFTSAGPDTEFDTEDDMILVARYDIDKAAVVVDTPTNEDGHVHTYDKQVISATYLASEANCKSPAKYYYSCECGAAANVAFDHGAINAGQHGESRTTYEYKSQMEHAIVTKCMDCSAVLTSVNEQHTLTADGNQCTHCWADGGLHTHTFDQQIATNAFKINDATCVLPATYYYSCACGEKGTEKFTKGTALGHTEVDGGTQNIHTKCSVCRETLSSVHSYTETVIVPTTCTSNGTKKLTCSCGYSYNESIETPGHQRSGNVSCTSSALCSVCGVVLEAAPGHQPVNGGTQAVHKKCSVCGTLLESTHSYSSSVQTAATCTTKGTTKYTCTCGYSYTSQNIAINASNHTGSSINAGTQSVHTKYSCCGATISTTHSYSYTVQTAAGCTTSGTGKYTCSCGYSYTSPISATGHTPGTAATCVANQTCTVCNTVLTTALGHNSVNGGTSSVHKKCSRCSTTLQGSGYHSYTETVQTAATCTATGTKKLTCSCGYYYTETIAMKDHTFAAGASCTTDQRCTVCNTLVAAAPGHRETNGGTSSIHKKCSVCGVTTQGSSYHSYTSTVTIAATCTTKGTTKYTCECGYSYTSQNIAINATNHTGSSINAGTSTAHTKYSCCGATIQGSSYHSYTSSVQTAATCTTKGTTKYTCTCGYSYTSQNIAINPDNHAGSSTYGGTAAVHTKYSCCGVTISSSHSTTSSVQTAATCTTKGTTKYSCACGYSYTNQDIPMNASNHSGSETFGGASNVHTKWSCCNEVISNSHEYTVTYSYPTSEHNTCTGLATCDCGYFIRETATGRKTIYKEPTCTQKRQYDYRGYNWSNSIFTLNICSGWHYEGSKNPNNHSGSSTNGGTAAAHTKWSCCNVVISSTHSMGAVQYTWSDDCGSCVATQACACGYKIEEEAYDIFEDYYSATCIEAATACHTASFDSFDSITCDWHTYGEPTGHFATYIDYYYFEDDFDEPLCGWAIAEGYCDYCGDWFEERSTQISMRYHVDATCSRQEYWDCTATFTQFATEDEPCCSSWHYGDYGSHTGSEVNGGTAEAHTKWSCCNQVISTEHTMESHARWDYDENADFADCCVYVLYESCLCGYSRDIEVMPFSHIGWAGGVAATCKTPQYAVHAVYRSYINADGHSVTEYVNCDYYHLVYGSHTWAGTYCTTCGAAQI